VGGAFITFEGIDGCGKTSQLAGLLGRLSSRGYSCIATREPGGTPLGESLRALTLERGGPHVSPDAELLLFAAARAQHVHEVIRPALDRGAVVLCDRFADSTVAFQGYGRGLDLDGIAQLNALATRGLVPDLTLWFDLDLEEAARRLGRREDVDGETANRFDVEANAFHERVRDGYRRIAESAPDRVARVEAGGSVDEVAARVDEIVFPWLERPCRSER
jgi:dTMP kinase